jgi:hypothetical protein
MFAWFGSIPVSRESFMVISGRISNASSVGVLIEDLTDDGKKLGLSKDIIEARVNAVLRKNGLKPVEATDHFYYVQVSVYGVAFAVKVSFVRGVTFNDGIRERFTLADTWERAYLGTYSSQRMDSILDQVSTLTEQFANEFLKANGK